MPDANASPSPAAAGDDDAMLAEIENEVELLSELLVHEFSAVERAATKVCGKSAVAKELPTGALLQILSKLRLSRAIDDFTTIYLDLKDEEALAARELLDELGEDDDDRFDDADFDDDFEDDLDEFEDEFEDELDDEFGDLGGDADSK